MGQIQLRRPLLVRGARGGSISQLQLTRRVPTIVSSPVAGVDALRHLALAECLHLKRFTRGLQSMCSRTLRQLGPLKLGTKRVEFCLHARLLFYLRHLPNYCSSSSRSIRGAYVAVFKKTVSVSGAWTEQESGLEELKVYHRRTGLEQLALRIRR